MLSDLYALDMMVGRLNAAGNPRSAVRVARAIAEIERLRAAVALHHQLDVQPVAGVTFPCAQCGQPWPCPTVVVAGGEP